MLVLAALIRFWGITAGAPYRLGTDEPFVVGTAMRIMQSGDFNPHFFHYGGLTIYLHTMVASVWFMIGAVDGRWASLGGVWIGPFLPAARAVTAALGTATVWLVYRAGLRIGPRAALIGAFVMAVLPQHVRESHYALTDTPLTLLVTLTLLLSLRATEQRTLRSVLAAGVAAGLTAAVKYNGGLALVMPLVACLALPVGMRARAALLAVGAGLAGFLAGAPYTVLDLPAFLNDFAYLAQSYNHPTPMGEVAVVYMKHLRNWFGFGTTLRDAGYLMLVLAAVGAARLAVRRGLPLTRTAAAVLLLFPLLHFLVLCREGSLIFGRYLLPLAPMLALAVGTGTAGVAAWSASRPRWIRAGVGVALAVVLALPMATSVAWAREFGWTRTEELASAWIVEHATADEPVIVEAGAILLPPGLDVRPERRVIDVTVDEYLAHGVVYLVSTSAETDRYVAAPAARPADLSAYREIERRSTAAARFAPGPHTPGPTITVFRIAPQEHVESPAP